MVGPQPVLCELIGEPIEQSAKLIGEPVKSTGKPALRKAQATPAQHEASPSRRHRSGSGHPHQPQIQAGIGGTRRA